MDNKKKLRRPVPSSSSSSSEDSSASSSSDDVRKKSKRRNYSSSSSEEEKVRKAHKHKKSSVRKHSHSAKLREKMVHGKKARSMSPATRAALKHKQKLKKAKYAQIPEHERRSRSPTRRNVKKDRTPEHRIASPTTRIRVSIQNNRAIPERSSRGHKESPMGRRREQVVEKDRMELSRQESQKESERLKRLQEDERYRKVKKHHHERSRSPSRGKVSIHDRLDGGYDPRRSISRDEREDFLMREPYERAEPERNFEYREEDRRYEYTSTSRPAYEDRHHRHAYQEPEREVEPRSRVYEPRRRFPEENTYESNYDKWPKEEKPMRTWKESAPPAMHPRQSAPKRYPYSHSTPSPQTSGPPFKPRFPGSNTHFSNFQKRFPFNKPRFPNQYSKVNNYAGKRNVQASATETSTQQSSDLMGGESKHESEHTHQMAAVPLEPIDNSEVIADQEEDKVEADTTTMSGNVDTQSQEEGEGNLSEFSDIDDEILNREEIDEASGASRMYNKTSNAHVNDSIFSPFSSDYYCIYGSMPRKSDEKRRRELNQNAAAIKEEPMNVEHEETCENKQKIISKIHANNELKREMDLDFEEISDGEFEEESRIKGLGDALGVDWESLAKETQKPICRRIENSTTKSLLTPHRILWDIGVSTKILGEETARRIMTEARDKLRAEKAELNMKNNGEMKTESLQNGDDNEEFKIKAENESECGDEQQTDDQTEHDFELDDDVLSHPLAQIQILNRKLKMKRKNLINNSTCKYGRALSSRKDLEIRRELCHLPSRDIKIDRNCTQNGDVRKNIFEIYKKIVDGIA